MVKMNNLTKMVFSTYAAVCLTGCATSGPMSRDIYKVGELSKPKIIFTDRISENLDDMIAASEQYNRFFLIKERIKRDINYFPEQDIRKLVSDIENSNLKNKHQFANEIKNFSYYRIERVKEKVLRKGRLWAAPFPILLGIGGIAYFLIDDGERNVFQKLGGIAISVGVGGGFGGGLIKDGIKYEYNYNEVKYTPYDGTTKVIKRNIGEPR